MILDGWSMVAKAQLKAETLRLVLFFRLASDPVVRAWSGVGDFAIPSDLVEPGGAIYRGIGDVVGWPAVQQLINGAAERVEFALSGVTAEILQLARDDAVTVNGATVNLGFCVLDADLQRISPVAWLWEGVADVVTPSRQGDTRAVTLSVGSLFTIRKRASLNTWTDAQQRKRSATDTFCAGVASLNAGVTKRFQPRTD